MMFVVLLVLFFHYNIVLGFQSCCRSCCHPQISRTFLFQNHRILKSVDTSLNTVLAPSIPAISSQLANKFRSIYSSSAPWTFSVLKSGLLKAYPIDLLFFLGFQAYYKYLVKLLKKTQKLVWRFLALNAPQDWNTNFIAFLDSRLALLAKIMGFNYIVKVCVGVLFSLGFRLKPNLHVVIAQVAYALFLTESIDMFKSQFLLQMIPSLKENRRQSYVVNRSSSVIIWFLGILFTSEFVSSFMKIPLSNTLAFGGFGGLALGLSAKDIASNFMSGMILLFHEPFTPGDMITFRLGSDVVLGRVEQVGWGQTRIRGMDTLPTYIPNSQFAQVPLTNLERLTHRKFELTLSLHSENIPIIADVVAKIKENLQKVPKLDSLSQPFRVSFSRITPSSLEIDILCYFSTKSFDEFLKLQQMANLEILKALQDTNASLSISRFHICHENLAALNPFQPTNPAMILSSTTPTSVHMLSPAINGAKHNGTVPIENNATLIKSPS